MAKQQGPTRHTLAIEELCRRDPDLHRIGFRKEVRARLTWPDGDEDPAPGLVPWEEIDRDLHFVPDAWKVVGTELHCYEIVDTAAMTMNRRATYGQIWNAFTCWGGAIRLFVSHVNGPSREEDLEQYYLLDSVGLLEKARTGAAR